MGVRELLLQGLDVRCERAAVCGGLELGDEVGVVFVEPVARQPGFGGEPGDGEGAVAAGRDTGEKPQAGFA